MQTHAFSVPAFNPASTQSRSPRSREPWERALRAIGDRGRLDALRAQLDADLVVMGTVGRTGIAGLFIGNTAEMVLEQVQCSVLAVKPAGFVSPVQADG